MWVLWTTDSKVRRGDGAQNVGLSIHHNNLSHTHHLGYFPFSPELVSLILCSLAIRKIFLHSRAPRITYSNLIRILKIFRPESVFKIRNFPPTKRGCPDAIAQNEDRSRAFTMIFNWYNTHLSSVLGNLLGGMSCVMIRTVCRRSVQNVLLAAGLSAWILPAWVLPIQV